MNSTFLQAITYCKKEGDFFESGKPPLDKIQQGEPESPEITFDVTYNEMPPLEPLPSTYEMMPNVIERMNAPSWYQSEIAYQIDRLMFTCFYKNYDVLVIHEHCPIHNSFLCDCGDDDEYEDDDLSLGDNVFCDEMSNSD